MLKNHKPLLLIVLCALVSGVFVGCNEDKPAAPSVLVVDLDKVAADLGEMDQMNRQIQENNRQLLAQRQQLLEAMQKELNEAKQKVGDMPTDEQKTELNQLAARFQQQLRQIDLEVEARSRQVRVQVIQAFREKAQPVVAQLARQKNAHVVLTKTDQIYWLDSSADQTETVLKIMKSQQQISPPSTTVPAPAPRP